jgi:hypothetical protein
MRFSFAVEDAANNGAAKTGHPRRCALDAQRQIITMACANQ